MGTIRRLEKELKQRQKTELKRLRRKELKSKIRRLKHRKLITTGKALRKGITVTGRALGKAITIAGEAQAKAVRAATPGGKKFRKIRKAKIQRSDDMLDLIRNL